MNVRQALSSEKRFLSPRRGSNPQPSDFWILVVQWLQCLTGHQKVATLIPIWGSEIVFLRLELTNVHLSFKIPPSSHISKIHIINIIMNVKCLPLRSHICRNCTLAPYLSLGSSMVTASCWSSKGCGFDRCLGLRNRFSEYRAWRTFIYHSTFFCFSFLDPVEFEITSDSRTGKPIACRILKLEPGSVTFEVSDSDRFIAVA